jgi:pyruvate dehydrogenase E1 component
MYLFQRGEKSTLKVQLMGSGAIFREVIAAAELLAKDFDVAADVWSVLGINQLHRDGMETECWNRQHPDQQAKVPYVTQVMADHPGPAVISTDYVQAYPEQIRRLLPNPLTILGTDGFGRSDSREALRDFFKVDRYHITIAALKALADQGDLPIEKVTEALKAYNIATETPHSHNQ